MNNKITMEDSEIATLMMVIGCLDGIAEKTYDKDVQRQLSIQQGKLISLIGIVKLDSLGVVFDVKFSPDERLVHISF